MNRKENPKMFGISARVYLPLANGTVPGVVVGPAELDTYRNRRGVSVPTQRVPVISYRELAGRDPWYQLTFESVTLLSARQTTVEGLDAEADGTPTSLPMLWERQRASLQAYLSRRQAQQTAEIKFSKPSARSHQAGSKEPATA
jgi:hypothetical protein